jgi:penicillin-binding protein 1A
VYAADGTRLGFIPAAQLRQPVPSNQIPQLMKQAMVAVEDRRFYQHDGVDYPGILRAAAEDIASESVVQGGSTITMQLVRTLYLTRVRTFKRKIEEATLAREMEKRRSKDWILTEYLNDVSYGTVGGQEAVGIQAAARVYFNKPAKDLTLAQAALLAGLPQAPSDYSPVRHPEAAKQRRAQVLDAMVRAKIVDQVTADEVAGGSLGLRLSDYYTKRRERHFFDYVESQLRRDLGGEVIDHGGLRIHTTLEPRLQRVARAAIHNRLGQPHDPASAVVSIDPRTGAIRAMATSARYGRQQFNYASQGHRQPGSTFKPIVLLAAITTRQADPRRTYYVSKPLDMMTGFGRVKVRTYDDTYGGRMNLVKATLRSDNSVYQQLDLDVGPDVIADTAANLGIDTPLDAYPAEGLGGLHRGVTPLELARAYGTLAAGGRRPDVTAIHSVDYPDGHTELLDQSKDDPLFKDGETYQVTRILQQNMKHGTGQAAQVGCPAAGKTGTTDDFRDAWFAGYTPQVATVVWVGYPRRAASMLDVHGIRVAGATFPAQIWHDFMAVAKGGFCGGFPKPREIPQLKPLCARLTVTRNCEPPPGPGDESQSPVQAPPQTPTVPTPAPAPDTEILGGPPAQTNAKDARFRFAAISGGQPNGFECSIDSGPFTACASPVEFAGLGAGDHVFQVRSVSPAGQPGAPAAVFHWTVFADLQPNSQTRTEPAPQPQPKPQAKAKPKEKKKQDQPPIIVG